MRLYYGGGRLARSTPYRRARDGDSSRGARVMTAQPRQIPERAVARPVYSVVAPVFNEQETVPHFYTRVVAVMEGLGEPFELVLVNDGSSDGSYAAMCELAA